jgi:hypothetical protein
MHLSYTIYGKLSSCIRALMSIVVCNHAQLLAKHLLPTATGCYLLLCCCCACSTHNMVLVYWLLVHAFSMPFGSLLDQLARQAAAEGAEQNCNSTAVAALQQQSCCQGKFR